MSHFGMTALLGAIRQLPLIIISFYLCNERIGFDSTQRLLSLHY
ncbi:hypothetical protein CCP3SC1AL1_440003 [Gammaproteobacteria bacterium]